MPPLASLLDLVAPPRCPVCAAPAVQVWCGGCLRELADLALPAGAAVDLDAGIRTAAAYAYAGVVRATVLAVKLGGRHAALDAMGSLLRVRLRLPPPGPRLAVTWVPASRSRRRRRGVDVARRLAGRDAVPLLRRIRDAPEQKGLDGAQRRRAAHGLFAASGPVPPAVVVVDDVRTTGATALAVGHALRAAGARRVLVATFAAVAEPGGRAQGADARVPPGSSAGTGPRRG